MKTGFSADLDALLNGEDMSEAQAHALMLRLAAGDGRRIPGGAAREGRNR